MELFYSFGLATMFVICATLLLWVIIGSRGSFWLKLPVILFTLFFSLCVWGSVDSFFGWASDENPPEKFIVLWMEVEEPSKNNSKDQSDGAIYCLLKRLPEGYELTYFSDDTRNPSTYNDSWFSFLGYSGDQFAPRLFKVPYSRQMHEYAAKVREMIMKNKVVVGEFNGGMKSDGQSGDQKDGENGRNQGRSETDYVDEDFSFYELPPVKIGPKH